ncbi:MAG: HAMP domain-containing protein [Deltaproteobacteria bacterium]|nr:HAMP domain-containing protein [Deltaproteobacteria bacterium]
MSSLRVRLFVALALATSCGALATGLWAIAVDATSLGFAQRLWRITPKALGLAALLMPASALAAAVVGRALARPIEELTDAATRIAEGQRETSLPRGDGDETRRLARALVSMRRELEGKPYAAAFLRDAWHDLKTPVAALRATLEVLDDEALEDRAATRQFLANMRLSTEQLERRLSDLVTLARFETAALAREEAASIHDLVHEALTRVAPLAEATQVRVHVRLAPSRELRLGPSHELRCDAAAIGRALGNLLENAVAATPGGQVELVEIAAVDGAKAVLEVSNAPASIPAHARKALFERAPKSRDGRGSGLGLAMARAAVEAHGGTIRFVELGPPRVRVRVELPR